MQQFFKKIIEPGDNFGLIFLAKFSAGIIASCSSTIICYPLDFARTRLATEMSKDENEKEFSGIWNVITKTFKRFGFFGLYSGLSVCLVGEVVYRGLKYGLYDSFKNPVKDLVQIEEDNKLAAFFFNWFLGWFISNVAATIGKNFKFQTQFVNR